LWAPRLPRRVLIVAVLCTIACAGVTLAAGEITLAASLPERARIMAYALIVASVAAFGATLPRPERWRTAFAIGVTVLSILPLVGAIQLAREIPDARDFAQRWDRFDGFLRRNRARNVFVYEAPGSIGTLRFLDHDPSRNIAIAMVYRLQSIAAMPLYRNGRMVIGPLPKDALRYRFE
jgi:MFS family permease